jgi:hypothetical protein
MARLAISRPLTRRETPASTANRVHRTSSPTASTEQGYAIMSQWPTQPQGGAPQRLRCPAYRQRRARGGRKDLKKIQSVSPLVRRPATASRPLVISMETVEALVTRDSCN